MDKIKAFLDNKVVKIIGWVGFAVFTILLLLDGFSIVDLSEGLELIDKVIVAILGLIGFIAGKVNKGK